MKCSEFYRMLSLNGALFSSMKHFSNKDYNSIVQLVRSSCSRVIVAALWISLALVSPMNAEEEKPNHAEKAQPVFLEIARDPNATAEQKLTVAAMMEFVDENDPAAAFEKLKASENLILYGGGGGADGLSDLTPIANLTNIETLVLFNHNISDITPLGSLVNLRTLRLEVNRIEDISPLANLRMLESIQINHNRISDLRPLSGLTNLRTLWITSNKVSDIFPLKELKGLRDLYLSGNKVTDLKAIKEMTVSDLRLSGNGITDISDLRDMNQNTTGFIHLDLSDNAIQDASPIGKLSRVTSLNLANNQIADVGELRNPALSNLNLANNRITDASELRIPALGRLELQGNKLMSIPDLNNLDILHINLRGNPIENYSDLVAFKKANPRAEILADEGFTAAFENSILVKKELVKSPLLGVWRTDALESEWGPLIIELRFRPNGVYYQQLLGADFEQEPEEKEGFTVDGRFSVQDDLLEMTFNSKSTKQKFGIEDDVLTIEYAVEKMRLKKIIE